MNNYLSLTKVFLKNIKMSKINNKRAKIIFTLLLIFTFLFIIIPFLFISAAFVNSTSLVIQGEADADADAVTLLKSKFATADSGIALLIGERGDAAVAEYANLIPEKAEGYYLSVAADKVVIAGNDGSGTYYGV